MRKLPESAPIQPSLSFCIEQMALLGLDIGKVLAGSGLDESSYKNPLSLVSGRQELAVYRNILRITGSPAIGLRLGSTVGRNALGVLGALVSNATDLGHAGYLLRRYNCLTSPWIVSELLGKLVSGSFIVRYKATCDLGELYRFVLDRDLRGTQALLVDVFGEKASRYVSSVAFGYPEPRGAKRYVEEFGCPVSFDRDATYVTYDSEFAKMRNEHLCSIAYNTYLPLCQKLLADRSPRKWHQRVLGILLSSDEYPSAKEISSKLACSERSLSRHLKDEGYPYFELIDRVRYDRAVYLLTHSQDSVKEIGFQLRYSEPANFVHAFIRWSGVSPTQFRNSLSTTVRVSSAA